MMNLIPEFIRDLIQQLEKSHDKMTLLRESIDHAKDDPNLIQLIHLKKQLETYRTERETLLSLKKEKLPRLNELDQLMRTNNASSTQVLRGVRRTLKVRQGGRNRTLKRKNLKH